MHTDVLGSLSRPLTTWKRSSDAPLLSILASTVGSSGASILHSLWLSIHASEHDPLTQHAAVSRDQMPGSSGAFKGLAIHQGCLSTAAYRVASPAASAALRALGMKLVRT